jgi:uncharacterized protein (TIGR03382 family)
MDSHECIDVDSMYTLKPDGRHYFTKGYTPIAIGVTAVGAIAAMAVVLLVRRRRVQLVRRHRVRPASGPVPEADRDGLAGAGGRERTALRPAGHRRPSSPLTSCSQNRRGGRR